MKLKYFVISLVMVFFTKLSSQTNAYSVYKDSIKADFEIDASYSPVFKFINKSKYATTFNWSFYNKRDVTQSHSKWIFNKQNISKEEVLSIDFRDSVGTYWVCLEAENVFGFRDTICKKLENHVEHIKAPMNVFVPSHNDTATFSMKGKGNFGETSLTIFDRWGSKVFESNDINIGWNGKVLNKGASCPEGTYYYIFKYQFKGKKEMEPVLNGTVTLMRQ
jgi:gliding motility-associated-like protein